MNPDRWKRVEEVLQGALDCGPGELDTYLRGACGDDQELHAEVRSLVSMDTRAGAFLEDPAIEIAARGMALEARTSDLAVGDRLSHYRIVGRLGAGGMGVVYKAEDTRLNRFVAIKLLSGAIAARPDALVRFRREARSASALNHPNICAVYDIGEESGQPFIVMEHVEGRTLTQQIAGGPLEVSKVLSLGIEIADALAAAHAAGIIHRDIKPDNIFVTPGLHAKILDFGLAKEVSPGGADSEMLTGFGTEQGLIVGTVAYMSPEQVQGQKLDTRTDLFSFGVVLYEMATGVRPFTGDTPGAVFAAIVHESAGSRALVKVSLPAGLDRIIGKCLEKDPGMRYQHGAAVRADLVRLKLDLESGRIRPVLRTPVRTWKSRYFAAGAVLALGIAGFWFWYSKPKLTDKDTIVLADFSNTTGDAVFDSTLRQGLAVQLEQSPYLSLISEARVQRTLGLMGKSPDTRLTASVAREVCERAGGAAYLEGSIAPLGNKYVLGLRARNCQSGDVVDDELAEAIRKEDVLQKLGDIAKAFRRKAGESRRTLDHHSKPLPEATTPSLDALKAYSLGLNVLLTSGPATAVPHFERAIAIDPQFAMAHAFLGRVYGDLGEGSLSAASLGNAYRLQARTSDPERFFIAANYDLQVTGNLDRARKTLESWQQMYPREIQAPGLLSGMVYPTFGDYEGAVKTAKKAMELDQEFPFSYGNLATAYQFLGRLDEADHVYRLAAERKLEGPDLLVQEYDLAFLRGDLKAMARMVALCAGKPAAEDWMSNHEALAMAFHGKLRDSRLKSRRAVELARQAGELDRAAQFAAGAAVREALFGNFEQARLGAAEARMMSKGRDAGYGAALAFGIAGDGAHAAQIADELAKRFPVDTAVKYSYVPTLRALVTLSPLKAIEELQIASPNELGAPASGLNGMYGILYPVGVRGMQYLKAQRYAEAAAEFQKILSHRGVVASDPLGALAYLYLGRALAAEGKKDKALAAYQSFLEIWNEADPDIPLLIDAKAEYTKLRA